MTSNANAALLQQLITKHSSSKKRMICGIVFLAVSFVVGMFGFGLLMLGMYVNNPMFLSFFLIVIPFWGMGLSFLITGIVQMNKLNRQIALVRSDQTIASAQPSYQQTNYQRPNYQQPGYQQANQQKNTANRPFVDIDLQKYAPLAAGVSYNPGKNYQFHRAEGFVGSVPQTFVNRTFPKCPLCCTSNPYWTIAQHNQMSWKGNLYLFKCSHCEGIISMSMPDVTTLANGTSGIISNPTVGLTNLMVQSSSGKESGAVYAVVESVGRSGVTPACTGKEFKLEQMQEMFSRM
ncbi:MAG: hypothetical protein IJW62_07360 [Clostridia bacterium]|nr:hypothetical protein [Clostridia bacterium]